MPRKFSEALTQVRSGLEFIEDGLVVEVGVGEQSVESSSNRFQILGLALCDLKSTCKVLWILKSRSRVIKGMDHVIHSRAILRLLVACAQV